MEDRLHKFAAIVETGSFTKAAAMLHISQPALSVAIAKLERALKAKLIQSASRQGITLTEAGRSVYAAALEHRAIEHNLHLQLAEQGEEKIPLRVGLIDSVAALVCAHDEPLRTLEQQTELSLYVANSANLRAAVQSSKLDLAVVVADDEKDAGMQTVAIGADKLTLVCHAEAVEELQVILNAGKPLPFISYIQTSATHNVIAVALERDRVKIAPVLYSTSTDVMLSMVHRGRGACILPETLVTEKIQSGILAQLQLSGGPYRIERRLSAITLKGRRMPPRLAGLAWSVREQLAAFDLGANLESIVKRR